jgi:hypothetical protein
MAPLNFSDAEFDEVLLKAEAAYAAAHQLTCPYFLGPVHFNRQGFDHLRRKSWNRGRERRDQFMRLKHVRYAFEILRLSRTVQGIQETYEWERRHSHGRWEKLQISVTYFEFVAVMDKRRFKVIVKQLPGGQRIFWSLIPFWRQTEEGRRVIHDGDPAHD